MEAGDGTDKYVLGMNNAAGKPTGDKRVREAIRYAIDHDQLIAARGGADKALGGPDHVHLEVDVHGLELAAQLVADVGAVGVGVGERELERMFLGVAKA